MATEARKDLNWQDETLCRLDHLRMADTSLTVLVPGYKSYFLEKHRAFGGYNVQSRNGGWNKNSDGSR
jgi:hypothetical protein